MNNRPSESATLDALDFPRIKEMVVNFCTTELGKEKAQKLVPNLPEAIVTQELATLEELLTLEREPVLTGIIDIRPLIAQAKAGRMLNAEELLKVLSCCIGLRECSEFFQQKKPLPRIADLVSGITSFPILEEEIKKTIDESGAIRDTASTKLSEIRAEIRKRRNQLVARLERMIEANPDWYQGVVMIRRERFVLPVKFEEKNHVPGVVHAFSDSEQTVFIEPLETILEQNQLQELRDAESEEIRRLLKELSMMVASFEKELNRALEKVGTLDFLLAKRRFAIKFNCSKPTIAKDRRMDVVAARHPLLILHKSVVVPLNFRLPDDVQVVVVSGPNAGGKTVVLKTLGLCSLLLKCGMFVPAGEGTRLPFFKRVFADIGDEQSLDTDTSSFAAHLRRLKEILLEADEQDLVLIDEIGAATAPEEGVALAMAVLEELRDRRVYTVATTHFNNLKVFVQDQPAMANAAMEFLNAPTYRLIMGVSGESSAFEIAASLGFPPRVLERAKLRIGKDWFDLKSKLQALHEELKKAQEMRKEAEVAQRRAGELANEYEIRLAEFKKWQSLEKARFKQEQEQFFKETRRQLENMIRELRARQADHQSIVRVKKFIEEKLNEVCNEIPSLSSESGVSCVEFKVGDVVESKVFRQIGRVVDLRGERAVVAFGKIKMELDVNSLIPLTGEKCQVAASSDFGIKSEEYEFVPKLNIRGMTREEAEVALNRFLEEAEIAKVKELLILHGKGTGALRQMLWRRLRGDKRVEKVRFAEPNEGGMGVTLVTLRVKE